MANTLSRRPRAPIRRRRRPSGQGQPQPLQARSTDHKESATSGGLTTLDDGRWTPKVKALDEVDTELPEDRYSRFVFHAFGDRLATESLSKVDDSFYNVPVGRICTKLANEFNVDLEKPDRYSFEVSEGAEAGAKVIERKAAAQIKQAAGKKLSLRDIAHEGSLGYLKYEICGISSRLVNLVFDHRKQIECRNGLRRKIRLNVTTARGKADGFFDHPSINLRYQAILLGRV
jgi:hypothetical protein